MKNEPWVHISWLNFLVTEKVEIELEEFIIFGVRTPGLTGVVSLMPFGLHFGLEY